MGNLVCVRSKHGSLLVLENHALLIESGINQGQSEVVMAHELKRVRGPLPRVYDGEQFQFVGKVEIASDKIEVVELCVGSTPALAFSYVGEDEPHLNPNTPIIGLRTELPPLRLVQPPAPPSLVEVLPETQPPNLVASPFEDGSRRVPLDLLYACTAPAGQRSRGLMNTVSLQGTSDLQQSTRDAAES